MNPFLPGTGRGTSEAGGGGLRQAMPRVAPLPTPLKRRGPPPLGDELQLSYRHMFC